MNFNDLVKHVSEVVPPFNDYALRGFIKEHIDSSPEFPAMVFREGFKLIDTDAEFVDYRVMTPEECVRFELSVGTIKPQKPKIPLTVTHMRLIEYRVRYGNNFGYARIYTPYMHEDMLHINDKKSVIRKVILEKTFARVQEKDKDGISVSPIRTNLMFNRRQTFRAMSYVTGAPYSHFIVTSRLYHGTIRNKVCDTTIVHYMLAKFGFLKTLKKFGLTTAEVSFTAQVDPDTENYEYFAAKKFDDKTEDGPGLFLKVKKSVLNDELVRKFVINLLYITSFFPHPTMDNVYLEDGAVWKIMLGIIILEDRAEGKAYSNAEANLRSVDHFIDPLTRKRFKSYGIDIEDIYDLLVHIFINIDSYMVQNQSQNIYNSRLDVSNGILVEAYAKKTFKSFYNLTKRTTITERDINGVLKVNPMMFRLATSGRSDDSEHYIAPPEIIGDNFLFSGGLNKIRLGGKAEQRLHPSMLVAESIDAFVGKNLGKSGYLNPYVPTDEHGSIIRPAYADDIDSISPYLPR